MDTRRAKVWIGSTVLLAAGAMLVLALVSPVVAEPAARIGSAVWSGVEAERPGDLVLPVETIRGVRVGAPVYHLVTGHESRPVAHVVAVVQPSDGPPSLRVRGVPGFDAEDDWTLRVYPPRRGLSDAFRLAVPPEAALEVGMVMRDRLDQLWRDELGPSLAKRLPAFIDRIDPRKDGSSKELLGAFGDDAMKRLKPLMDDLLSTITKALQKELRFMDRMGVLWKFVRGDGKGIQRKVQPVAEQAAHAWWATHQHQVFGALGDAFKERLPDIRRWLETDVLKAAREELFEPILEQHRARIEAEGEALVRLAMREIVESEEGGFRVRFAAMLRMTLLGKKRALILLERPARATAEGE